MADCIISSGQACGIAVRWEATLWQQADELVGGDGAWLIIDDTALPKKGKALVGVAPHYATAPGKNANCQTMVSVTLALGEPGFAADGDAAHRALGAVVGQADPTVVEESGKRGAVPKHVVHGFGDFGRS